eukprot:jgi/Mesen1/5089/ME000252S04209
MCCRRQKPFRRVRTWTRSSCGRSRSVFTFPSTFTAAGPISVDEKLDILRERRGLWFEYACHITELNRAGITSTVIDEATGLTGVEQNALVVAAQVHGTLQANGISPGTLAYFDVGGADILYELRVLSGPQRVEGANYVAANKGDQKLARELARSMKELERRTKAEGRDSFSATPGDALAFSLYRAAKEQREEATKKSYLERGLSLAETESARRKLRAALGLQNEELAEESPAARIISANLQIVRLASDETITRPVPVLGDIAELDAAAMAGAPQADLEGPFRIFSPSLGVRWAAVPGWPGLVAAIKPVALLLSDFSSLPGSAGKPVGDVGLLLVDVGVSEVEPSSYYVIAQESGKGLTLEAGGDVVKNGHQSLGKVMLGLLPAIADEGDKAWE